MTNRPRLTFRPIRNEKIVVMRGDKVAGTITRYRGHGGCIVHVPGVIGADAPKGTRFFRYVADAKAALLAADAADDSDKFARAA